MVICLRPYLVSIYWMWLDGLNLRMNPCYKLQGYKNSDAYMAATYVCDMKVPRTRGVVVCGWAWLTLIGGERVRNHFPPASIQ